MCRRRSQTRLTAAAAVNWMWGASANELLRIQSKMVKHRSNSFSSSREQFVRVLIALHLTILFHNCVLRANELNKNNGIMLPNRQQQIVNSGDNVTITCIFIHSAEIKWIYPEYLFKTPQVSQSHLDCLASPFKKSRNFELTDQHERQTFELYVRKERDSRFVDNDPVKSPAERHGLLRVLPAPVWRTASQTISLRLQ